MNCVELMKTLTEMSLGEFLAKGMGTTAEWERLQTAKRGRIVVRIIEGGNEYLKLGQSLSGTTPCLAVGFPVAIDYPKGWYSSTAVEDIHWNDDGESGIFKTLCSIYSFHFCR